MVYAMDFYWEVMRINNLKERDIEIFDDFAYFVRADENIVEKYSGEFLHY